VGEFVGQAFGGGDNSKGVAEMQKRQAEFADTYGQSEDLASWVSNKNFKPEYAPISADTYGEYGMNNKETIQRINTSRAKWSSLSDAERAIATDEQKSFALDFEKYNREKSSLQQASRIMDQRELASKNAGAARSGGTIPLTGAPGVFQPPTNGAKTRLGE
jgi:hypothetical protein